jgi:hypothetical protein
MVEYGTLRTRSVDKFGTPTVPSLNYFILIPNHQNKKVFI